MDRPCVMHPADDCSRELPCAECPNCGHGDHAEARCVAHADGRPCTYSWPDPYNFTTA